MEENISLKNESQKKFEKTVKGLKKILKEKNEDQPEKKSARRSTKNNPVSRDRGVVYIGHIPHGFYEDQMKSYFKQFGKVTNVRVARSMKNGKSKGYAFVEFQNKEVAQIVAQTMNNYLMDKRLLKAEYVPPEKQRAKFFSGEKWVPGKKCPGITNRNKAIKKHNSAISDSEYIEEAKKQLKKLYITKSKLRKLGIDYDFFQPCDIPEELLDYKPFDPKQKNLDKKNDQASTNTKNATEDNADTVPTSPKKIKKQKKEKSMNKPISPIVKPPKKKKMAENGQIGQFVRPLMATNIDQIAQKKKKKSKVEVPEEVVSKKKSSKLIESTKKTTPELKKKGKKSNKV